jgi:hypothetical protein
MSSAKHVSALSSRYAPSLHELQQCGTMKTNGTRAKKQSVQCARWWVHVRPSLPHDCVPSAVRPHKPNKGRISETKRTHRNRMP